MARLRMFAGPNGSGKSTLKSVLRPELLGVYVNPDEMLKGILDTGKLDVADFGVEATAQEIEAFFRVSTLLAKAGLQSDAEALRYEHGAIDFSDVEPNAYHAAVAADFVRRKLVEAGVSFTFETVMSSPDKVAFLAEARERGFRTYLYYVATVDPLINVNRVANRVRMGGHPVPEEKIVSRYARSLDLLVDALRHADRAYVFDNSGPQHVWVAEVTDGEMLEMRTDRMPDWFKSAVWDKL